MSTEVCVEGYVPLTAAGFGPISFENGIFDLENAVYTPAPGADSLDLVLGVKPNVVGSDVQKVLLGLTDIPSVIVTEFGENDTNLYEVGFTFLKSD